ncbi:MAG: hypothetical protein O3C21_10845 [Verrucomicrobia bacterium]|nr:hypothetical protein [Verrucomicrobiota bacterium]
MSISRPARALIALVNGVDADEPGPSLGARRTPIGMGLGRVLVKWRLRAW